MAAGAGDGWSNYIYSQEATRVDPGALLAWFLYSVMAANAMNWVGFPSSVKPFLKYTHRYTYMITLNSFKMTMTINHYNITIILINDFLYS